MGVYEKSVGVYEKVTNLTLGRQICGHWDSAASYEWLMTNGIGGYACGTVALANTRRYHGFLMASLTPPVQRTLLVAKIDLSVEYQGRKTDLSANEFADGTISPQGFVHLESFAILEGIPTWRYAIADALLQQTIFMAQGVNTSYLRLELIRGSAPMRVTLKPLVAYRDYHSPGPRRARFSSGFGGSSLPHSSLCRRPSLPAERERRHIHSGARVVLELLASRGSAARAGCGGGLVFSRQLQRGPQPEGAAVLHRHR